MNDKENKGQELEILARELYQEITMRKNPVYIVDAVENAAIIGNNAACFYLDRINGALNSADGKRLFCKPIETDTAPVVIIAKAGNRKIAKVAGLLRAGGITVFLQDAMQPFEPITETDKAKVKELLLEQYRKNNSAGGTIAEFDNVIKTSVNTPAIKTGFPRLDNALDGGLYEGLHVIGAISSLGKTTFCLNIAEQIANKGTDVFIIALEMSKYQLMSRSISRLTFQTYKAYPDKIKVEWCKTSRGISDGNRYKTYNEQEKALIKKAKEYYAEKIGKNIYIHEAIGNLTVDAIRDLIERHIEYTGNIPVVIVDYLQLVKNADPRINANDKTRTDYNLTELKQLSRDYKLPVLLISSFNRAGYNTPVKFECFKESGGIDFGCDVIMGLQLAGVGNTDFDVNEAKAKTPREIELVFLKNREAAVGDIIKYSYNPKFNDFEEIPED